MKRTIGSGVVLVLLAALAWRAATRSVDFPVYHHVAQQILQGNFELYPRGLYDGSEPVAGHGFRYAPAIAFLLAPLGLLPVEAAALLFFCLKLVALLHLCTLVVGHLGAPVRARDVALMLVPCIGGYLVEEFRNGNAHFFTVWLVVVSFLLAERGRVVTPAITLALASAVKITPLLLLPYFALRRRTALCLSTLAALLFLFVAPAAIVGSDTNARLNRGFVLYALEKVDEADNVSLRGLIEKAGFYTGVAEAGQARSLLDMASGFTLVWAIAVALGSGATLYVLWRRPPTPEVQLLELSIVLTAALLAAPHTQRQHLTALIVPMAVFLARTARDTNPSIRGLARAGLAVTAAASTVLPLLLGSRRLSLAYQALAPYTLATLALFVVLLVLTARLKAEEIVTS